METLGCRLSVVPCDCSTFLQAVKKGIMSGFFWSHGLSWNHVRFNEHLRNGAPIRTHCRRRRSNWAWHSVYGGNGYRRVLRKYPILYGKFGLDYRRPTRGLSYSQYERNHRYLTTSDELQKGFEVYFVTNLFYLSKGIFAI